MVRNMSNSRDTSRPAGMGQALKSMRTAATYSMSANKQNAVASMHLGATPLRWYRLDDGVMGGQSETRHADKGGVLTFQGTLDTRGGGFASVRADFAQHRVDPQWQDPQWQAPQVLLRAHRREIAAAVVQRKRPPPEAGPQGRGLVGRRRRRRGRHLVGRP